MMEGEEDAPPGALENKDEQLYKVLVIGDYGVGKTAIIRRATDNTFTPNYKLTIGVDFSLKKCLHKSAEGKETNVVLQLWDIAGHERFGHLTHVYYKGAIASIVVFDLGRPATFESVLKWQRDLHSKVMLPDERPIPCILLANKCDISPGEIDTEKLDKFCQENNFAAWFATSAKMDKNIDESINFLVGKILEVVAETDVPLRPREEFIRLDKDAPGASGAGSNNPGAPVKCCE